MLDRQGLSLDALVYAASDTARSTLPFVRSSRPGSLWHHDLVVGLRPWKLEDAGPATIARQCSRSTFPGAMPNPEIHELPVFETNYASLLHVPQDKLNCAGSSPPSASSSADAGSDSFRTCLRGADQLPGQGPLQPCASGETIASVFEEFMNEMQTRGTWKWWGWAADKQVSYTADSFW